MHSAPYAGSSAITGSIADVSDGRSLPTKISPPPRGVRRSSSHVPPSISLLTAALVRLGATSAMIPI